MHLVQTEYVQANTVHTNYHVAGTVDFGTKATANAVIITLTVVLLLSIYMLQMQEGYGSCFVCVFV